MLQKGTASSSPLFLMRHASARLPEHDRMRGEILVLNSIKLEGVGPADQLGPVDFSPRVNFITGDNGLGKSFLLDIGWWALTRNWARGVVAAPRKKGRKKARISYSYSKRTSGDFEDSIEFNKSQQIWPTKPGRPPIPGVVIYAGVDGGFSVWDPSRNYWTDKDTSVLRPTSFDFSSHEVWNGLRGKDGTLYCKGLIQDWVLWQQSQSPNFTDLERVLASLSPSDRERIIPGKPVRFGIDATDYPSLKMPYDETVALIHASAAMKRICALAYLLVWTWNEHVGASQRLGRQPAKEVIFLVDEIECHLHPQWQRRIVPSLLSVMTSLTKKKVPVQLIVATHSPLVLASTEVIFDEDKDKILTLSLNGSDVRIEENTGSIQGSVSNWLVSEAFGLRQARSIEAEEAIEVAERWMRGERNELPSDLNTKEKIHSALFRSLRGGDDFWPRWLVKTNQVSKN